MGRFERNDIDEFSPDPGYLQFCVCLKAWRDALLFMIGFTLYLYFLHTDLMRWIAVRDLLIMTVILVSAQTGAGHTLCSKFWQPAWVPFFLYLGIYPYVWGATSTEIPFQRMRPELYAAFFSCWVWDWFGMD